MPSASLPLGSVMYSVITSSPPRRAATQLPASVSLVALLSPQPTDGATETTRARRASVRRFMVGSRSRPGGRGSTGVSALAVGRPLQDGVGSGVGRVLLGGVQGVLGGLLF